MLLALVSVAKNLFQLSGGQGFAWLVSEGLVQPIRELLNLINLERAVLVGIEQTADHALAPLRAVGTAVARTIVTAPSVVAMAATSLPALGSRSRLAIRPAFPPAVRSTSLPAAGTEAIPVVVHALVAFEDARQLLVEEPVETGLDHAVDLAFYNAHQVLAVGTRILTAGPMLEGMGARTVCVSALTGPAFASSPSGVPARASPDSLPPSRPALAGFLA